jgi:hypothetical protein
MDKLAEISHGAKVVLGAGVALLVFSFFDWFEIDGTPYGANMWSGVGVVAGLFLIALIVWQAIRLANINLEIGVTPSMITAALAVLTLLFVFIRWIDKPGGDLGSGIVDRTIWAWLGLILAIVVCGGAWMNMKAAGESLSDVRDTVSAMTGSTGAGAGGEAAEAPAAPSAAPAEDVASEAAAAADDAAADTPAETADDAPSSA